MINHIKLMIALITLFMSNIVSAEALVNQFDCKVKSLNITVVKDGVVTTILLLKMHIMSAIHMIKVSDKGQSDCFNSFLQRRNIPN